MSPFSDYPPLTTVKRLLISYLLCAHVLRFQNYAAVMSVTEDLLCAFELLKPLDGAALRKEMIKGRKKRSVVLRLFTLS